MAFNFGGAAAAPSGSAATPAAAPFSFGAAPAQAPATTAASTAPTPAPAFNFGGAPAPAAGGTSTTPAPAPAFGFGSAAPAPAAGGTSTTPASAPAFSFGGAAPAPAAGATSTAPAPAPAFSFGGAAPAPAAGGASKTAPAFSTTTAFGATTTTGAGTGATTNAITSATTLVAPNFDETFENLDVWSKTRKLCTETSIQETHSEAGGLSLAGQDLIHFISARATTSFRPKAVEWTPPDNALRQKLAQQPCVGLSGGASAKLTVKTLEQIGLLSTELRISEAQAITLYAQVSKDYDVLNGLLASNTADGGGGSLIDRILPGRKYDDVAKLARDFYFYERRLKLETILYLMELRLHNNPNVIRATDAMLQEGLVTNLLSVIREYTQRIQKLQQEIKSNTTISTQNTTSSVLGGSGGFMGGSHQQLQQQQGQGQQNASQFAKVHLLFCTQERQTAAEALVFIAYHTQLEVNEVAAMIDSIRELSTGTPKLSPFKNVPSPYESPSNTMDDINNSYQQHGRANPWPGSMANASYNQYPWDLKEKNALEWQKELIRETCDTGQPRLLQCYSLLVVAAMASLDSRQILYDRKLHSINDFGRGNQLLHPTRPSLDGIKELHTRLKPGAHEQWSRPDIWGLLACSYALLLRLTPTAITSPTKGGSNTPFSKEVREAARYCIEIPTELMSFTFCRLTLIPSLEMTTSASMRTMCRVSEFCLSIVSEVYSLYLSILSEGTGNLPISRKSWQDREEENLKLRREQYNNQLQFEQYMGNQSFNELSKREKIPMSIDLMDRHECLDDLIALATTLCSLGPNYSRNFWAEDKQTNSLVPSRALQECTILASQDNSLVPYVYSWMAALSNDKRSAKAINNLMSNQKSNENGSEGSTLSFFDWSTVIFNLRYYVQQLSPNSENNVSKSSSPMSKSSSKKNTSYYYNLEGNAMPDRSSDLHSRDRGGTKSTSSSSSKKSMKAQELSERSKLQIASYLALIMNVSLHCFEARHKILLINLPLVDGDFAAGRDECLVILFKLAIAPLSPQIRGTTLSTIASLLHPTDGVEDATTKSFLDEQASNAWEYLESCSLLPINLLDRYRVIKRVDTQDQTALGFPPSSMALASLPCQTKSTFPKHPMYGILYEMDHIESKKGWYPSTEGFLDLLHALVSCVGCPSTLGRNWRVRTGCTPFIEYVINFVLPKAFGINNYPPLPFRVPGDRSRLVARALAVVEAVIIRYNIPAPSVLKDVKGGVSSSLSTLGIQAIVDKVHVGSKEVDAAEIKNDFRSMTASSTLVAHNQQSGSKNTSMNQLMNQDVVGSPSVSTVPIPKSPGFTILVELLSSSCGVLLQVLAAVITECGGPSGVLSIFRDQSDKLDMTYALFGSTPPNVNSAKEGMKERGPTQPLQNLLKPFSPKFQKANIDDNCIDNSLFWRETSVSSALRILCAGAAREEAFMTTLMAAEELPLKLVPVVEFQELKAGSGSALAIDMKAKDVNISSLSNLLFSMRGSRILRSTIIDYIGYESVAQAHSTELSAAALSIFHFLQQKMSPQACLRSLIGDEATIRSFSKSVANRLRISAKNSDCVRDTEVLTLILDWILSELRSGVVSNDGLTQILMGLPGDTTDGNWKHGCGRYSWAINDCFDAILDIVGHNDLFCGFSGISSLCFETFFRLHDLIKARDTKSLKIAIYAAERLRDVDFWTENVTRIPFVDVSSMNQEEFIQSLHSTGWLLKGLACELRLLVGFANDTISTSVFGRYLEQHPVRCNLLLSSLYGPEDGIMCNLVRGLPLELVTMDPNLRHPSQEALRAGICELAGAHDVVQGYTILDSKKVMSMMDREPQSLEYESAKKWIEEWNIIASRNCAVSHLTNAISILIDASLYSVESMACCHTSLSEHSNFSHSWLHNNGSRDLLVYFLQRLEEIPSTSNYEGMDNFLVPVATKNLSNIVLTLSEFTTSLPNGGATNSSDLLQLAALVARTIPPSSIGNDTAEEAPIRYERTATLGSALSLLLRTSASLEPEFVAQYQEDFIIAAQKLTGISGFKVDSRNNNSNSIVSLLARSCVSSIVLALSEVESELEVEKSYSCSCIPQLFLERSISLVAELDEDICNFLQVIALRSSGAKMLIDAGIGQALLSGATQYMEQERIVNQNLKGSSSRFNKTTIRTPDFLLSHLKLICALLVPTDLPEESAYAFASKSIEIIGAYQTIIQRLCYNFPAQADFLRWFLKVLVSASAFVRPLKKKLQVKMPEFNKKAMSSLLEFINNDVVMLLEQLSENPLPRDVFPERMPRDLENPSHTGGSTIVHVEKDGSATWWDVLESILMSREDKSQTLTFPAPMTDQVLISTSPQNWTEDTFEYSIVAADILCLGLQLVKRSERSDLFNGSSLAFGLFRCAFAAKIVNDRLESVQASLQNSVHFMRTDNNLGNTELELEYLTMLASSLAQCVEQLLMLCLQVCDAKENKNEHVLKKIFVAIESSGIDRFSLSILEEGTSEFITILCDEIKKLCR